MASLITKCVMLDVVVCRQSLFRSTHIFFFLIYLITASSLSLSSSESLGSPLSVALPLPLSSSEPVYHSSSMALSSLPPPSLGTTGSNNPPSASSTASPTTSSVPPSSHFSTVGVSYDGTMPPHARLAFSQSKEVSGPVMVSRNS